MLCVVCCVLSPTDRGFHVWTKAGFFSADIARLVCGIADGLFHCRQPVSKN